MNHRYIWIPLLFAGIIILLGASAVPEPSKTRAEISFVNQPGRAAPFEGIWKAPDTISPDNGAAGRMHVLPPETFLLSLFASGVAVMTLAGWVRRKRTRRRM